MRDDYVLWHCNWHKAHWPCCAPPQCNLPFVSFTLNVNSLTGSLERGPFTHPLLSLTWFSIDCSRGSECGLGNFEMKREFFSSVIWDTLEVRDFSCKTVMKTLMDYVKFLLSPVQSFENSTKSSTCRYWTSSHHFQWWNTVATGSCLEGTVVISWYG
jgi:hypothetical protein